MSSTVAVLVSLHFPGLPWLALPHAPTFIFSLSLGLSSVACKHLLVALKEKWLKKPYSDDTGVTFPVRIVQVALLSLSSFQSFFLLTFCFLTLKPPWSPAVLTLPAASPFFPKGTIYYSAKWIMAAELLSADLLLLCICVRAAWCQQTIPALFSFQKELTLSLI